MIYVELCELVHPIAITLALHDFMRNIVSSIIIGGLDDKEAKATSVHEKRSIIASLNLTL